jgi:hypothetical protein
MVKLSISTKGRNFDKGGLKDFFKPPPSGMTPINNSGWYAGPEQVSPMNCDWYPDSPWCGSNPFENPFTESPISLAVEPYVYECGIGVQFSGTAMWIKTRIQNVEYRFPGDCRKEPEKPKAPDFGDKIPKPEQLTPPTGFDRNDISETDIVFAGISVYSVWENYIIINKDGTPGWIPGAQYAVGHSLKFDLKETEYKVSSLIFKAKVKIEGEMIYSSAQEEEQENGDIYNGEVDKVSTRYIQYWNGDDHSKITEVYGSNGRLYQAYQYDKLTFQETENIPPAPYESLIYWFQIYGQNWSYLIRGRWGLIKKVFQRPIPLTVYDNAKLKTTFHCFGVLKLDEFGKNPYRNNPPPPPEEPPECCMQCCSPSQFAPQNNNDALLRQILKNTEDIKKALGVFPTNVTIFDTNEDKEEAQSQTIQIGSVSQGISRSIERIEKISKIIGIDVFPLKLPASLIEKVDSNVMDIVFDWFTPDEIRVNNVMSLLVYTLKYLDGVIGKWQQKIHIEDADAVKEGKQPKDIVLPDIANTLREITSVSTANHKALGLITDVCVKIITEVCNAKLDVAKTKLIVRDIQQFLSYTSRELAIEVPLSINIPDLKEVTITGNESEEERKVLEAQKKQMDALKNDLSKYLQPGTCKVVYEDWDGNKSLTDYFLHLATLMATARGQNG